MGGQITSLAKAFEEAKPKTALDGKTVGLYFSAHWCGPCRGFTSELVKTYNALKAAGKDDFEIVFVSGDRSQEEFDEYFATMPWLAVPFADEKIREKLNKALKVQGIPHFTMIGPDGAIINEDARGSVMRDPTGASYPWPPPPYFPLSDASFIDEEPTLVAFVEGCSAELGAEVEAALKTVAEAKAGGPIKFAIAKSGDPMASRVRSLITEKTPGPQPAMIVLNIPDNGALYEAQAAPTYNAVAIETFLEAYGAGALPRKQLGP